MKCRFSLCVLSCFLVALAGCGPSAEEEFWTERLVVVLERVDEGVKIHSNVFPIDAPDEIIADLKRGKFYKLLLGRDTSFTVGELMELGPRLEAAGYELYMLDENGDYKRVSMLELLGS